jgi:putative endonuclease
MAVDFLLSRGFRILGQNVRTAYGEIDVVALAPAFQSGLEATKGNDRGAEVVFIEVKTRSSKAYGLPEEAITAKKKEHLLSSARAYLQEHPELPVDWRVDVIAIRRLRGDDQPEIVHFENAIS